MKHTKRYYECHITILGDKEIAMPIVMAIGWTFSCIDGDPDLGKGVKCYATKHFNRRLSSHTVKSILVTASEYLRLFNINVIREKIELVIYDNRIKK